MRIRRLIFIVSISFTLLVNIPRLIFLFGVRDTLGKFFLDISTEDMIFRILSMFCFCYTLLKLNIEWFPKWFRSYVFIKSLIVSLLLLVLWNQAFALIELWIHSGESFSLNPRFHKFVYFFVMVMLLIISKAILLDQQTKQDAIEKERLKHLNVQNELQLLKSQLNPHFLFNSLNSLNLLVRKHPEDASTFIQKLSLLYRYILQSSQRDLVTIEEELHFLDHYIYVLKQRYRDNFSVVITIDDAIRSQKIPSMTLQLLIENAVKHNEISSNNPLIISIYTEASMLIIKNKIQQKITPVESLHLGLHNLNSRYKLLLDKEILILKDSDYFMIKLPIA